MGAVALGRLPSLVCVCVGSVGAITAACSRTGLDAWGSDAEPVEIVDAGADTDADAETEPPQESLQCPDLIAATGCSVQQARTQRAAVNVLIALDESGSMDFEVDGVNKWVAASNALTAMMEATVNSIRFGLELFPFPDDPATPIDPNRCGQQANCCEMPSNDDVNVPISSASASSTRNLLARVEPAGGTPTALALSRVRDYFANTDLSGDEFVLLVTDGGPNCNPMLRCSAEECTQNIDHGACPDAPEGNCCDPVFAGDGTACVDAASVTSEIMALSNDGVPTVVVGIPGSEPYARVLDEAALAGGMPTDAGDHQYYRVDDVRALGDQLNSLVPELISDCTITLDQPTNTKPVVAVDCEELPSTSSDGQHWRWAREDGTIVLIGDTCEQFRSGDHAVDIIYGCSE